MTHEKSPMDSTLLSELLDDLGAFVRHQVRGGFTPVGEIPEAAVEYLADGHDPDLLRAYAEHATAEALVELSDAETGWPAVTDCDRLDAAFASLETVGILARQDFGCCQTCGHVEIWEELQSTLASGRRVRGYTFYHRQDTESAVDGYGLYLAYGAADEGEAAALRIGHEVAAALRARGLQVAWNGDLEWRLSVRMEWKRRLA